MSMKNERIITHFQSYTTANDCVKELTPYFTGRISLISPLETSQPDNTAVEDAVQAGEGRNNDDGNLIGEASELGFTAAGALSYLLPGASTLVVGGPSGGAAMGSAVGGYLSAMLDGGPNDDPRENPDVAKREEYLVAVIAQSQEEARRVEETVQRHGGTIRSRDTFETGGRSRQASETVGSNFGRFGDTEAARRTAGAAGAGTSAAGTAPTGTGPSASGAGGGMAGNGVRSEASGGASFVPCTAGVNSPDIAPLNVAAIGDLAAAAGASLATDPIATEETSVVSAPQDGQRRVPGHDGYDLDPVQAATDENWVDPNIGYGNFDIVDPSRQWHDPNKDGNRQS